jgi:hypothetical protein
MYPQVTQFETRERLMRDELQVLRERVRAQRAQPPARERSKSRRWPLGLAFALRGQAGSSR